jgi:hypothetical protein
MHPPFGHFWVGGGGVCGYGPGASLTDWTGEMPDSSKRDLAHFCSFCQCAPTDSYYLQGLAVQAEAFGGQSVGNQSYMIRSSIVSPATWTFSVTDFARRTENLNYAGSMGFRFTASIDQRVTSDLATTLPECARRSRQLRPLSRIAPLSLEILMSEVSLVTRSTIHPPPKITPSCYDSSARC